MGKKAPKKVGVEEDPRGCLTGDVSPKIREFKRTCRTCDSCEYCNTCQWCITCEYYFGKSSRKKTEPANIEDFIKQKKKKKSLTGLLKRFILISVWVIRVVWWLVTLKWLNSTEEVAKKK